MMDVPASPGNRPPRGEIIVRNIVYHVPRMSSGKKSRKASRWRLAIYVADRELDRRDFQSAIDAEAASLFVTVTPP